MDVYSLPKGTDILDGLLAIIVDFGCLFSAVWAIMDPFFHPSIDVEFSENIFYLFYD